LNEPFSILGLCGTAGKQIFQKSVYVEVNHGPGQGPRRFKPKLGALGWHPVLLKTTPSFLCFDTIVSIFFAS
jgi:hypothetical protein